MKMTELSFKTNLRVGDAVFSNDIRIDSEHESDGESWEYLLGDPRDWFGYVERVDLSRADCLLVHYRFAQKIRARVWQPPEDVRKTQ